MSADTIIVRSRSSGRAPLARPGVATAAASDRQAGASDAFELLGIRFANLTSDAAIDALYAFIVRRDAANLIFIANAHTLTLASQIPGFADTLRAVRFAETVMLKLTRSWTLITAEAASSDHC